MELRFIYGRAGSGKTTQIYNEIKEKFKNGLNKKLILIVPEQLTLESEKCLIEKTNMSGIINLQVLSFERLLFNTLNEVGGLRKTYLNSIGKVMAIRKLFNKHSKDLKVYKKASSKPGFLTDFSELITEFKRNDITPEILDSKLNNIDEVIVKSKLEDIRLIYENFNDFTKDNYADEDDRFNKFIDQLDYFNMIEDAEIWIDEFSGFTSQQFRVIEKLLLKANRVNITLTYDVTNPTDNDVFSPVKRTIENLKRIASDNGISGTEEFIQLNQYKKHVDLEHLERNLYAYPYQRYINKSDRVRIFSGTNRYTEIEYIASEIITLVRDKKYRWNDIALVSGALDNYTTVIKNVFREYGIPCFIDEKRNILNNLIVIFIISALEIVNRNFIYEDVFKYIKTGLSDLTKEEAEELENYVIRFGIKGEKWFHEFTYGEEYDLEYINNIRLKFINPFINFKEELIKGIYVLHKTRAIINFINECRLHEKLEDWIKELKLKGNLEYVYENTQIWNIMMEVFEQLVEILGDTKISNKEYLMLLESGFSDHKIGIIPPTIDQVIVGNIDRSKRLDLKVLFVVGVNDGIIPKGFSDSGILLDDEKIILKDIGLDLNTDNETKALEERFLIYSLLSSPKDYITLSYALGDSEGKSLRPSILIDRIKSVFPEINVLSDIQNNKEPMNLISRPLSTIKYLTDSLRNHINGGELDHIWYEVYEWYYNNETWDKEINNILEGLFYNNQTVNIKKGITKKLYEYPFKSSISKIEKFINCPFSYFIDYGLKPEERKEYEVNNPELGSLFHLSLERYSNALMTGDINWKNISKEVSDKLVEDIVDSIIPNYEYNVFTSTHRYKYLINRVKRISKKAVWTLAKHLKSGEFNPIEYEYGFGEGEKFKAPPIIIELPNGDEIRLEGRIDRVDIFEDGESKWVKIIDYKSGNKKFSLSDVYNGLQIQLVVYLDSIIKNFKEEYKNNIYPGGVFYFKIDDPMINSDTLKQEDVENELMKKMKLDGLIIKDIKVIKAMDENISITNNSNIVPASLTKSGELTKRSSTIDENNLNSLINHVKSIIVDVAVEILNGNIKIEPCKTQNRTSCDYCQSHSICQFDTTVESNNYRNIKKITDEEILNSLSEDRGDN